MAMVQALNLPLDVHDFTFSQSSDLIFRTYIKPGRVRACYAFSRQGLKWMKCKQPRGGVCAYFPPRAESLMQQRRRLIRQIRIPLSSTLVIGMLLISPLLHSCCDNDLWVAGHTRRSSFLSVTHTHKHKHTSSTLAPPFSCYLRCQLPVGDDFSDQAPLSVAGGVVDHLLPQQLAYGHVLKAVALGNLQALCSFATARAT